MIAKHRRQSALLRLVRARGAENQAELIQLLRGAGIATTQASVSRDIRELGLVKVNGRYRQLPRAATRSPAGVADPLHELVTSVEPVGANLIIIRTRIGAASAVAVAIDSRDAGEIAGTLAGDDTVFVAVRSRAAQGRALALLRQGQGNA